MSVSTSVPATIEMRRNRLFSLVAAVALLAAGITAVVLIFAVNTASEPSSTPATIAEPLWPGGEQAAAFRQFAKGISTLAQAQQAAAVLNALGLSPKDQKYIQAMTSLSPVEQAAAFGGPGAVLDALELSPRDKQYVMGITSMSPVQQAAAFGGPGAMLDFLGLSPWDKKYVMGITRLTKAQQAAAFGR